MSLAPATSPVTSASRRYEICQCENCEGHYPLSIGFNRRFCRSQCKYRSLAQSLLDTLRYDHRYCANCYRKMKSVEPPGLSKKSAERGKSIPECATGRQYYREHCQQDLRNTHRASSEHGYASVSLDSRMTCSCPVNAHTTIDRPAGGFSKEQATEHAERLSDALRALYDEQAHGTAFDDGALVAFVEQAKARPGLQGRDQEVLRNALAFAIRRAR
jgi:hypothetical protein